MKILKSKKGYTLVELLIVIAIMSILIGISVPVISGVINSSRLRADQTYAKGLQASIELWLTENPTDSVVYYHNLSTDEAKYTNKYMGTNQLPGIEFTNANNIRMATITAIKSLSTEPIEMDADNKGYIAHPSANGYGYKYYYRLGVVSVEKIDSPINLHSGEGSSFFIWLDKTTADASLCTIPIDKIEKIEGATESSVPQATFRFNFALTDGQDIEKCVFEISNDECSYTLSGKSESANVFIPGKYNLKFYYNGTLKYNNPIEVKQSHITDNLVKVSFTGSVLQFSSNPADFEYSGNTITKYIGDEEVVVIPSKSTSNVEIKSIAPNAFYNNAKIKRIIVPKEVLTLESNAISFCDKLEYLSLPSPNLSANSITNCDSLKEIDFYIPEGFVYGISSSYRSIGANAIHTCKNLKVLNLSEAYRHVDVSAFSSIITQTPTLTVLFKLAPEELSNYFLNLTQTKFYYSSATNKYSSYNVNTISLIPPPNSVEPHNENLIIPSVYAVDGTALKKYTKIASNDIYTQTQKDTIKANGDYYAELTLGEGFETIEKGAFRDFKFTKITLPSTLKTIGDDAFRGNNALVIDIPSSVTSVGKRAFYSDTVQTIVVRCDISGLNPESLGGCENVKTLVIHNLKKKYQKNVKPEDFGLKEDVSIIFM